jgi:hypothetical protein
MFFLPRASRFAEYGRVAPFVFEPVAHGQGFT